MLLTIFIILLIWTILGFIFSGISPKPQTMLQTYIFIILGGPIAWIFTIKVVGKIFLGTLYRIITNILIVLFFK